MKTVDEIIIHIDDPARRAKKFNTEAMRTGRILFESDIGRKRLIKSTETRL